MMEKGCLHLLMNMFYQPRRQISFVINNNVKQIWNLHGKNSINESKLFVQRLSTFVPSNQTYNSKDESILVRTYIYSS